MRNHPGSAVLLFITDKCPVGCMHCSVDSRRNSPTINDFTLFNELIDGLCLQPKLQLVGISGGEPFIEKRGLTIAVQKLQKAKKAIALYTSGVWASSTVPAWIHEVLKQVNCIFLSTDAFHAKSIKDECFIKAAQIVVKEGAWLIVQVLNIPAMVLKAQSLLRIALGVKYDQVSEISLIPFLPYGRASKDNFKGQSKFGNSFGVCNSLNAPVVRYDGTISACCNEQVIMGHGPSSLRKSCSSKLQLQEAIDQFKHDPLLQIMKTSGISQITQIPGFAELSQKKFSSICELCWEIQRKANEREKETVKILKILSILQKDDTN